MLIIIENLRNIIVAEKRVAPKAWEPSLYMPLILANHKQVYFLNINEVHIASYTVLAAALAYGNMITGKCVEEIFTDFGTVWRELAHEEQLRWVGTL